MARRRRPSESTCREDASIADAAGHIAGVLAERHPEVEELRIAQRMCHEAYVELTRRANAIANASAPAETETKD